MGSQRLRARGRDLIEKPALEGQEVPKSLHAVGNDADAGLVSGDPANADLADGKPVAQRESKPFYVKGEPVDGGAWQNHLKDLAAVGFQPALSIPNTGCEIELRVSVQKPAWQGAKDAGGSDKGIGPLTSAGGDGDIGTLADGPEQMIEFGDGKGAVGVRKGDDLAESTRGPGAYCGSFSPIFGVPDPGDCWRTLPMPRLCHEVGNDMEGGWPRAVRNENEFRGCRIIFKPLEKGR